MKRGTPEHPKVRNLRRELMAICGHSVSRLEIIGIVEMLFHFTARYAIQGNIGKWDDEDIADGLLWFGEPADLIEALVRSGWVDKCEKHRLVVHDWGDHIDKSVQTTLRNKGLECIRPHTGSHTEPHTGVHTEPPTDPHLSLAKPSQAKAKSKPPPVPALTLEQSFDDEWNERLRRIQAFGFGRKRATDLLLEFDYSPTDLDGWAVYAAENGDVAAVTKMQVYKHPSKVPKPHEGKRAASREEWQSPAGVPDSVQEINDQEGEVDPEMVKQALKKFQMGGEHDE